MRNEILFRVYYKKTDQKKVFHEDFDATLRSDAQRIVNAFNKKHPHGIKEMNLSCTDCDGHWLNLRRFGEEWLNVDEAVEKGLYETAKHPSNTPTDAERADYWQRRALAAEELLFAMRDRTVKDLETKIDVWVKLVGNQDEN